MVITQVQLQQIIRLSRNEQMAFDIFMERHFPSGAISVVDYLNFATTPEYLDYQRAEEELQTYIAHMNYDAVLDLETLMEYGRELSECGGIENLRYMVDEDLSERVDLLDSQKSFSDIRDYYFSIYPSPDGIELAAAYLAGKPLVKYLGYAMEALNI